MEKVKKLCQSHLESCQLLVKSYPKVELLQKALHSAESTLEQITRVQNIAELANDQVIKPILSEFTQSCLDSTYHLECQLVDKEFPDHVTRVQIVQIIETLSLPLTLCGLLEYEVEKLGVDIIECLHWRVGALMYMYCHMVLTVEERKKEIDVEHFKQVLCLGVAHLHLMLCTRAPLSKKDDYVSHDTTVPTLLQNGIFSDLHMLSLMYAGEMCHWYYELSFASPQPISSKEGEEQQEEAAAASVTDKTSPSSESHQPSSDEPRFWCVMELTQGVDFARQWRDNFNSQKYGIEFLSKYIDVARGPLKDQSWNYVKAVQFLVSLKKSNA